MENSRPKAGDIGTILPTPLSAIKQAVCFSCFKFPNSSSSLSKCGACKRVSYCSPACQKQNWNEGHKKTCKILVASNKAKTQTSHEDRSWKMYRDEKMIDVSLFRSIDLKFDEQDHRLVMYEPYCRHCYRSPAQLNPGEKLKGCEKCYLTTFCSLCPQTHDSDECGMFRQLDLDEEFIIQHHKRTGQNFAILCTDTPRDSYVPLSTATGWYEYFTKISDKSMLSEMVSPEMVPLVPGDQRSLGLLGLMRCSTSTGTMALTVIAALEAVFPDISTRTSLKLHFVGAALREIEGLMVYEELLHLFPSLKQLELTYIGIDIPKQSAKEVGPRKRMQLGCCPPCTDAKRTRSLALYEGTYHDYSKTDSYETPDLAIAFHTGFSQEAKDEWEPTIELLSQAKHPTVFTAYNENEMTEETALLKARGVKFIQEGEINRWKGMCPILEAMEEKENSVYYLNYYWYIIAPE